MIKYLPHLNGVETETCFDYVTAWKVVDDNHLSGVNTLDTDTGRRLANIPRGYEVPSLSDPKTQIAAVLLCEMRGQYPYEQVPVAGRPYAMQDKWQEVANEVLNMQYTQLAIWWAQTVHYDLVNKGKVLIEGGTDDIKA